MKNKELAIEKRHQIAAVIRTERENKNLSIEEVSDKVGISVSTLKRIEEGKFSPDSDLLCLVLDVLGLEIKIQEKQ